jgi:hypothetical protein
MGEREMHTEVVSENMKRKDCLENLGAVEWCGLDALGSGWG